MLCVFLCTYEYRIYYYIMLNMNLIFKLTQMKCKINNIIYYCTLIYSKIKLILKKSNI